MFGGSHSSLRFSSTFQEQNQNLGNSYLTQSFHEQRQVEDFLRNSKLLNIIKTVGQSFIRNYKSSKRPEDSFYAIIIKLTFFYSDFINNSLELLNFLIEEPVQFDNAVKYCVFALLRDIVKDLSRAENIDKINIDIDQVHSLIRFVGLPLQKDLCFQPSINLYRTGLSEVVGVLSAITQPEKVVKQSVWYCSSGCEHNKIRTNLLDVPTCAKCRHPMSEYTKLRYTEDFHFLRILPAESIETPRKLNKIFRALTVRVAEHVFDSRIRSMESNINLESLNEISKSQLETLLRYDSPPETPIQQSDQATLSGAFSPKVFSKSEYDVEANSINCINHHNREQFVSQMDSQIDFSIFQHYSPNTQWSLSPLLQTNENNHSIIVTSSLDAVEILDTLTLDNIDSHLEENTFKELDKIENTTFLNSIEKHGENRSITESSHSKEYDFEEVDSFFKKMEFISNLDLSHINKMDSPDYIHRKCQTQLQLKQDLNISHKKVVASCPVHAENHKHNQRGDTNTSQYFTETNLCLSLDKHFNDNIVKLDDIFKVPDTEHIFGCQDSGQRGSQAQIENNLRHLFDEKFSKDKTQPTTTSKNSTNINIMVESSSVPFSVRQLYDIVKTNYSDFAFIYALSSQLCQDRVPMECFVTLKIALLLSLVSIGNNENRPPIPIVAMTNDTYMTDYLMTNIGQLGSRFLGPVDETKSFSVMNWIEADSILLARGGVYYAGDWTRLKLRKAETIFKNIECSSVAVEKSTLSFPLETAIWTHWRSFKHGAKDQQMFNKFLKIFGIPIFVSDDNHEALIDYILEQSSIRVFESTVDHLSINEDDMRNFLIYVSQLNVELSAEAAVLLKNYFVTSRSKRPDCLSKQSYTMLKQFAESFAKLSMRNVVSSDDALAAIIMCEHFIENIFSSGDKPIPHFGNFNFIGAIDKYLTQFKEWLNSYIEHFINE